MPSTLQPQTSLAQRLAPIVADICAKIAAHASRNHALVPLLVLVWTHLHRMLARLDRLVARWQTGRLRPARSGGKHRSTARPNPHRPRVADPPRPAHRPVGATGRSPAA